MVAEGDFPQEEKDGNDGADELARRARDSHPINREVFEGIWLRTTTTMLVQKYMSKVATERSAKRIERELEEAERDMEERNAEGGDCPTPPSSQDTHQNQDIRNLPPCEMAFGEVRNGFIERMNVRYPGWLGITTGQNFARKPLGPIPILNERAKRWVYPFSWMAPLHWYLSKLQWPSQENPNDPGITWIELVLDFEISTRVQLLGTGARTRPAMRNPRDTDIAQRANNFAHAANKCMNSVVESACVREHRLAL